jgi:hypothetical protein
MRYRAVFQNLGFVEDSHILVRERKPTVMPCPARFPVRVEALRSQSPAKACRSAAVQLNGLMTRGGSGEYPRRRLNLGFPRDN